MNALNLALSGLVGDCNLCGFSKDISLTRCLCLCLSTVIDLFKYSRNCKDECWFK